MLSFEANTGRLLLSTRNATLADFVETMLGDAYSCYQCDGKANSLHKLQQRVTEIQNELLDKLRGLHEGTDCSQMNRAVLINVQGWIHSVAKMCQKQMKCPVISYILSRMMLILVTTVLCQNLTTC